MFKRLLIYLVWVIISAGTIGGCIQNIKNDHPYIAGFDIAIFIYSLIQFYPLLSR